MPETSNMRGDARPWGGAMPPRGGPMLVLVAGDHSGGPGSSRPSPVAFLPPAGYGRRRVGAHPDGATAGGTSGTWRRVAVDQRVPGGNGAALRQQPQLARPGSGPVSSTTAGAWGCCRSAWERWRSSRTFWLGRARAATVSILAALAPVGGAGPGEDEVGIAWHPCTLVASRVRAVPGVGRVAAGARTAAAGDRPQGRP
jgi:hypothetical protein